MLSWASSCAASAGGGHRCLAKGPTIDRWRQRLLLLVALLVLAADRRVSVPVALADELQDRTPTFFRLTAEASLFADARQLCCAAGSDTFLRSFANSAIVSVVSTLIAMLVGVPGAYALSRTVARGPSTALCARDPRLAAWRRRSRSRFPYFLVYRYARPARHAARTDPRSTSPSICRLVVWLMRSYFDDCAALA